MSIEFGKNYNEKWFNITEFENSRASLWGR